MKEMKKTDIKTSEEELASTKHLASLKKSKASAAGEE